MFYKNSVKIKQKDLEINKAIIVDMPEQDLIYIPLANHSDLNCECLVNVGDIVGIGTPVGARKGPLGVLMHSSVSGEVISIDDVNHRTGNMVKAVVIKNDKKNTVDENHVKPGDSIDEMSNEKLVAKLKEKGIVGMGGSTFPTHVKYNSNVKIDTVLINAVECEPYLASDYAIGINMAEKIIAGTNILMKISGASEGLIAVKEDKVAVIAEIEKNLSNFPDIKVKKVKNVYPMGWEKVLIKEVTGKTYTSLPSEAGLVVNNSMTAIAVFDAIKHDMPVTYRVVTVTGDGVNTPCIIKTPIGVQASELVKVAGGYVKEAKEVKLIAGGPMMGAAVDENFIIDNGVNGLLVVVTEDDGSIPSRFRLSAQTQETQCISCGSCVDVCPIGLQPVNIMKELKKGNMKNLDKLGAMNCVACGLCSFVCPANIDVRGNVGEAQGKVLTLNKNKRNTK